MKTHDFDPSPLTEVLHSRGLTLQSFAAMAEIRDYSQVQAYKDLLCLASGGDPDCYLKLELLLALSSIGVDFYRLREDLKSWGQSLPYCTAQSPKRYK